MIINTEIPAGIDTSFLRETISNSEPSIRREGRLIIIPVFIRTETVEEIIVSDDDTVAGTKDVIKYRYY